MCRVSIFVVEIAKVREQIKVWFLSPKKKASYIFGSTGHKIKSNSPGLLPDPQVLHWEVTARTTYLFVSLCVYTCVCVCSCVLALVCVCTCIYVWWDEEFGCLPSSTAFHLSFWLQVSHCTPTAVHDNLLSSSSGVTDAPSPCLAPQVCLDPNSGPPVGASGPLTAVPSAYSSAILWKLSREESLKCSYIY